MTADEIRGQLEQIEAELALLDVDLVVSATASLSWRQESDRSKVNQ